MNLVFHALTTSAGIVLLAAGFWKIRRNRLFRGALRVQGLHSKPLLAFLSRAVPSVELFFGGALLLFTQPVVFLASAVFGLALLCYVTYGFIRFRDKPCGCLSADETFGARSFVRAALIVVAGPLALYADEPASLASWAVGVAIALAILVPVRRLIPAR